MKKPVSYLEKANIMAGRIKTAAEAQMKYDKPIFNWNWYVSEAAKFILKEITRKQYYTG